MQPEKSFYRKMAPFCKKNSKFMCVNFFKLDHITHGHLEGFHFLIFISFFFKTENAFRGGGIWWCAGGKGGYHFCLAQTWLTIIPEAPNLWYSGGILASPTPLYSSALAVNSVGVARQR
jgi:hypothetical protein